MTARLIALVTSMWFVVGGMLAAHHEARAAHFVDGHGLAFHGSRMTGEHTHNRSDVHSRDAAPDHDACGIAGALDQPSLLSVVSVSVRASVSDPLPLTLTLALAPTSADVLRIAPKTSPPTTLA